MKQSRGLNSALLIASILGGIVGASLRARAQPPNDGATEIHEFAQLTLSAGRCERQAANNAVNAAGEETADDLIQFVLEACKGPLLALPPDD